MRRLLATAFVALTAALLAAAPPSAPDGWTTAAPRDEIRPAFAYEATGGPDGKGAFVITADHREGLDGWWTRTFPVEGGKHYRFQAFCQAKNVAVPRRSVVAQLH
jgi:hypothetical protein